MLAIPPVIVIGLEMISSSKIELNQVVIKTLLLTACALIGGGIYFYIEDLLMVLLVNFVTISVFLSIFKQKIAPAYAIALLPIVLKTENPIYFSVYVFVICFAVLGGAFLAKYLHNKYLNPLKK